jgi:oxygen-dependent protoporphyrinogen oxidase
MPELPLSAIYSLNKGIEQLVAELIDQTRVEVKYQTEVTAIRDLEKGVEVVAGDRVYQADAIFCALPVSATRHLLNSFAPHHAEKLSTLKSFSITVINVGYTAQVLPVKGFGYLTSRDSKEEILGVIFDSCVFPEHNRSASETRLTIKLQGRGLSKDSMIEIALQGIKKHLGITRLPDAISYKLAVNAIPQYGVGHLDEMAQLEEELMTQFPRFRFVGNYLSGTSVDRCIARSKDVAYQWLEQHL